MAIDKKIAGDKRRKIYFCTVDHVLENDGKIIFINSNEGKFYLYMPSYVSEPKRENPVNSTRIT